MTNKEKADRINNLIMRKQELERDINITFEEFNIVGSIPICPEFPNFPNNLSHHMAFEDLVEIRLPIAYLLNYSGTATTCILRVKDGAVIQTYEADEEFSRGAQLRIACDEAQAGEVLYLSKGKFNINGVIIDGELVKDNKGWGLTFPNNVTIIGMGIDTDEEHRTTLYAKFDTDFTCGAAFQLKNSYLQNLVIEGVPLSTTDDVKTIGFHEIIEDRENPLLQGKCKNLVTDTYDVTISHCHIISNAWGFYSSSNKEGGDSCIIQDSIIESNRQGISLKGRGSYSNQNKMEIYSCKFIIDGRYSKAVGAVSRIDGDQVCVEYEDPMKKKCIKWDIYPPAGGIYGVISRGTELRVKDCIFELTANRKEDVAPKCPLVRCVGISDTFDNGSKPGVGVKIESINNTFTITANDASDIHTHLRMKKDTTFSITNSTTHIKEFEHSYELEVTYVAKRNSEDYSSGYRWYPTGCENGIHIDS